MGRAMANSPERASIGLHRPELAGKMLPQDHSMPTTYNGIGTHYYGKKNITKRPGPCPHCNRAVELTSYDTRLWFVIFFIPVFPLGRKRLLAYCPACTRHYAVDAQ